MTEWKIPLFQPNLDASDASAAAVPIQNQWLTLGSITQQFEKRFSQTIHANHAYAVSNGTAALHLALLALGIGHGDEVLLPTLTFVGCANVVLHCGAKPVFVDCVSKDDWTICEDDLAQKITPKSKAVIVVHYAGFPCKMKEIAAITKKHNLRIIEDCAHAMISKYEKAYCGTLGDIGCFSLFSNKNITCGEGGIVTTQQSDLAERLRLLRSHGMTTLTLDRHRGHAFDYDVTAIGHNFRIDEVRSAIAFNQLQKLPDLLHQRHRVYQRYVKNLLGQDGLQIPFQETTYHEIGYHIFPILLTRQKRDKFMQLMKEAGIQTSIHYPPIHLFSAYEEITANQLHCPLSEEIAAAEVTLPFYPNLQDDEIDWVCENVLQFAQA